MASQHGVDSSTRAHAARLAELTQQLTAIAQELAQLQDGSCPPPEPSVAARSISDGGLRKRAASTPARRARKGGDGGGDSGGDSKAEAGPTGKRRRRKTRGASVAKDHASDDEGAGAKGAESTGGESECEVVRPDIYPHAPRHQLDSLESNKFEDLELLDALKLRTFEGFYNLSFVVLLFALTYISVRNIKQHGFFLNFNNTALGCSEAFRDFKWLVSWILVSFLAAVCLFFVQKMFSLHGRISHAGLWGAYIGIQTILLVTTTGFIYVTPISPAVGAMLLMWLMVLMMKLHSYVATNFSMHLQWEQRGKKVRSKTAYPYSVTAGNFVYFIAAPTLVYESHYARSERIRKRYVLKKTLQGAGCALLQYVLMAQFILPVLRNEEGRGSGSIVLDLMKLAVPSFTMWLAGFYMLFHCLLNVTAELLRFSDRKFFDDWWNATSLGAFWRKWNIPVHEWCLRHVFIESQHYYQASVGVATFATFLISAILHELLFSVAFKTFKAWFFLGMLMQIPLIFISRFFKGKRRGNFLVWLSLFASQPLLEILYFRAWYQTHDNFFCVPEEEGLFYNYFDSIGAAGASA